MKKVNKKGFVLAEAIIISVVVISALLIIYIQFSNLNNNYYRSLKYNNVDKLYLNNQLKKYIAESDSNSIYNDINDETLYIDVTNCSPYFIEYMYCRNLIDAMDANRVIITKNDTTELVHNIRNYDFSENMKDYIKNSKTKESGYRIIVEYNDGSVSGISTYIVANIDTTIPNISIASISTKTDRAVVSATCSDSESGITKYEFSSDNGSTWIDKGEIPSHTFTGLTHGTDYNFKVRCTNGSLLTNEAIETKATLKASNPTITQLSQTPSSGTYATQRVIRITYNGTGIENPKYYYSLDGNTWTLVSDVTKDVSFTSDGYLYAKTVDDAGNTATASTYTVANIDTTAPSVSASVSGKTATFTMSDNIGVVAYGVNSSTTVEPTYTSITTTASTTITWESSQAGDYVVWVKDVSGRVSNASFSVASSAFCQYNPGDVIQEFNYTGGVQTFTAPCDGTYKLEVWGAQGGNFSSDYGSASGGKGGYSYGNKNFEKDNKVYVVVGAQGTTATMGNTNSISGGYNGGGAGYNRSGNVNSTGGTGGGGGATHIATTNRGILSNYASYKNEILLIAGGGGGGALYGYWDSTRGYANYTYPGVAGNETSTTSTFGSGSTGGGGGYNGGLSSGYMVRAGGGGSGYIGGVTEGSMSSGQRSGNGYAKITFVSYN